jgi:hypothetical protein
MTLEAAITKVLQLSNVAGGKRFHQILPAIEPLSLHFAKIRTEMERNQAAR